MKHWQSLFFANAQNKGIVGIFVLILVLVIAVAGGAYYLGRVSTKLQPTKTQQPAQIAPSPDPTVDWGTYASPLFGVSLKYPSEWLILEKKDQVNTWLELEDKPKSRKITVFKDYIGGAAGFKYLKEDTLQVGEKKYIKDYYTEEENEETISIFVSHKNETNKYLIIGNWKIGDGSAEKIFDQILSTFRFIPQ